MHIGDNKLQFHWSVSNLLMLGCFTLNPSWNNDVRSILELQITIYTIHKIGRHKIGHPKLGTINVYVRDRLTVLYCNTPYDVIYVGEKTSDAKLGATSGANWNCLGYTTNIGRQNTRLGAGMFRECAVVPRRGEPRHNTWPASGSMNLRTNAVIETALPRTRLSRFDENTAFLHTKDRCLMWLGAFSYKLI